MEAESEKASDELDLLFLGLSVRAAAIPPQHRSMQQQSRRLFDFVKSLVTVADIIGTPRRGGQAAELRLTNGSCTAPVESLLNPPVTNYHPLDSTERTHVPFIMSRGVTKHAKKLQLRVLQQEALRRDGQCRFFLRTEAGRRSGSPRHVPAGRPASVLGSEGVVRGRLCPQDSYGVLQAGASNRLTTTSTPGRNRDGHVHGAFCRAQLWCVGWKGAAEARAVLFCCLVTVLDCATNRACPRLQTMLSASKRRMPSAGLKGATLCVAEMISA